MISCAFPCTLHCNRRGHTSHGHFKAVAILSKAGKYESISLSLKVGTREIYLLTSNEELVWEVETGDPSPRPVSRQACDSSSSLLSFTAVSASISSFLTCNSKWAFRSFSFSSASILRRARRTLSRASSFEREELTGEWGSYQGSVNG